MRILPDHPSIDFLKREAKDVLVAMREADPNTTLSTAQRTLAAQYGFSSWAALKADVERLRTDVPHADPVLTTALADAFGLGDVRSITPLSYEPTGRRWELVTDAGRFRAGPFYRWLGEDQARLGARLAEAARTAGVTAPEPVRSRAGNLVEHIDGTPWRVDRWLDLGPTPMTPVRAAVARRVGEIAGTLHALAIPTDLAITPYLRWRRPRADWTALVGRAVEAGREWAPQLEAFVSRLDDLDAIRLEEEPEDVVLTNCNLVPEAFRMGRGDDLVVVEWNFTGALSPALELAGLLVQWGAPEAILDGYRAAAGSLPDLRPSSFAVAVTGWLNWAYARFCDAIGDEKSSDDADDRAFAERETLDLLADPMSVEKIEQLLDAVAMRPAAP